MARRILHVIWIGLLWHSCGTWKTSLAARSTVSSGSADRQSSKNGRPILAMANSPRCIYNGKPVEDGRQVSSPEPCLNCTCNKGVLLCYLQSCMPVLVPSPECYVARVKGHCCPEVFCKVPTTTPSPSGTEPNEAPPGTPIRRSDDTAPSKKRTTPANGDSIGLLPVLLKRNHNKASSVTQTTLTPIFETTLLKSTPYFFQNNHRPGGTVRDRPHFKRRSTTAVNTRSSPSPAISRKTPPPRVTVTHREPPEEEERDKIVYDLRLGASQNSTKSDVSNHSNNDTTSCYVNGYLYSEGMAMLSTSKCEYCYCIRGHQMCVRPKCHLKIDGCEARYHSGFTCCPSHYHCEPEVNKSSAELTDIHSSKLKPPRPTAVELHKGNGCLVDGHVFSLGVAVPSRGHCQTCYCTQVGVVCRRLECAPRVDGCEPVIPDGHCCPKEYTCGIRGLNESEGLVSHSTDNYDVTVFSSQPSGKIPPKNQPTAAVGTTTPEDGNSTVIENAKDGQKVTVHLQGSSQLEKVSILPNENLAILVVTTEEQNYNEQSGVTKVPELPSKKSKPSSTGSVPIATTKGYDSASSIKELRSSETAFDVETSSRTTASGIKGKITSHSTKGVSPTQATIQKVTENDGTTHSAATSATNGNNDYYYDDDYDYSDYFYDYKRPPGRVPVVDQKLNKPQAHITQTFAPFPESDRISFGDRINQKNRQPGTTVSIHHISGPSTPEVKTAQQATSDEHLGHSTTRQPWSSIKRPPPNVDQKPSKVNFDKISVVQPKIPEKQENREVTVSREVPELTTDLRDAIISQGMLKPSTSGILDLNDPSFSTTKRQSPVFPQFTVDIVSDRFQTTSSDDYRHTSGSSAHLSNQKRITTENPHFSQTRDVLFEIPTRSRRPILTKAPGIKRPQITVSYPVLRGNMTSGDHFETKTSPSSNSIKTINNVLPQGIAEVLWSLTESTPQSYEHETSFLKTVTSTIPEEVSTVSPTTDAQEILASPKLIVQSSLTMKGQYGTEINPTTGSPVVGIHNPDPPAIIFSNHRPSFNKRPIPPIHTIHPQTTVNNHKNYHTSFSIPVRQKTTTEPILEFSNHKPITSTSFRPPPFPGEIRKPGFFRPIADTNKNRFSPYKVHRVIPEATNRENSQEETELQNSEEKSIKTEDLLFGLRTSNRPFGQKKQPQSAGSKITPTLRWNDASTNPVTVGFDVKPNIYEMEPEMKEAVDDQFELNAPTTSSHSMSDHAPEVSPSSAVYTVEDVQMITQPPLTHNNHSTFHSTSPPGKHPHAAKTTESVAITVHNELTTKSSSPSSTASEKTESDFVTNTSTTGKTFSVNPASETESSQSPLEFRNNVFVPEGNIDNLEGNGHSTTEEPITVTSYDYSKPSTVSQSKNFTVKADKDSYHDSQEHNVQGSTPIDKKQPSTFEPSQQSEVSQDSSSAGNDTKLYRAEEGNKHAPSSFIDRLVPYGGGHEQRLPQLPARPHHVLPEKKTTTPAPQVTSPEEKEIRDVCFVDGRFYKSGEVIVKENPCEICQCFYGHPLCQIQQCPPPPGPACILEYLSGYCCPRVTCGVKLDGLRPPSDMNSIFSVPNDVRPPSITMDNQWKPVESPRPVPPRNTTSNGNQPIDGQGSLEKDQSKVFGNGDAGHTSDTDPKGDLSPEVDNSSKDNFKEYFSLEKFEPDADNPFVTTTYSSEAALDFQPKPVFDPNSIKKPGYEKKDSKEPSGIHDNSSGVRKILNEAVTLPPFKMSVPPPAAAEVNPILPFFHVRTPPSKTSINQTASPPSLDFIIGDGMETFPPELGGNLKISGCNVYGKYYKINDKVSALSQACSECICTSEGITCHGIC